MLSWLKEQWITKRAPCLSASVSIWQELDEKVQVIDGCMIMVQYVLQLLHYKSLCETVKGLAMYVYAEVLK